MTHNYSAIVPKRKVTIEDVARKAGVSISTVSRVMNNNRYIAEGTRKNVLEAISALDYRPNALAKGLKQMKTNSIGLILSNLQNPFWLMVLEGIEDACQEAGYSLLILNSRDDLEKEGDNVKEFMVRQLDGIIINPAGGGNPLFNALIEEQFPVVFLNRKVRELDANTVVVDNVQGAMLAINHLLRLEKNKIALFSYPTNNISPRLERIEGYKKALNDHGHEVNDAFIKIVGNKSDCLKSMKQLFDEGEKPNAIFSTNNMLTLIILDVLGEMGIKVPEEVSLVGYDETEWSKHLSPPLTTVKQPAYEMGKGAAEKLIRLVRTNNQDEKRQPETIQFKPTLVIRNSCGEKS